MWRKVPVICPGHRTFDERNGEFYSYCSGHPYILSELHSIEQGSVGCISS